jgi:hypothetical protein
MLRPTCPGTRAASVLVAVVVGCLHASRSWAQSLEPRAYANAPVGLNFVLAGYAYSIGTIVMDPSIPIQDGELDVDFVIPAYARALGIFGKSSKIQLVAPYAWLSGSGVLTATEEVRTREVSGFADPIARLAVNFFGAPALKLNEFPGYRESLIVGASLLVTVPVGQYDASKLVNIGTNRWSIKPEIGVSKSLGPWVLESMAAVSFYTANEDFFGGQVREQDPVYSLQAHAIYNFTRAIWAAVDATYYGGGQVMVNGVESGDLEDNWRVGGTLTLPLTRNDSIKLFVSDGLVTRAGSDFLTVGFTLQRRWGGGL